MLRRSSTLNRVVTLLTAAAAVTAVVGTTGAAAAPDTPSAVVLGVQTYNLDLGADLTPLFTPGGNPMEEAAGIYQDVQDSLPAERMQAIAKIIAAQPPEVVGLQEVATWQLAPWAVVSGLPVATGPYVTTYDFLGLLLDDLAALGTPYTAVATDTTFDSGTDVVYTAADGTKIPVAIPLSPTQAGRYIDRNVIIVSNTLARRASTSNPQGHNYAIALPVSVSGLPVTVHRGWASVDITTRGRTVRLYDTHLEAYGPPPVLQDQIRNAQASELKGVVQASSSTPSIVVGDINARPTMCQTWRQPPDPKDANVVAYTTLQSAGLTESWPLVHPDAPCDPASWTSGENSLAGPNTLSHRIDDVFVSSGFTALESSVVGDTNAERTQPSGLWPSDHASTVAKVRLDVSH